MGALELGRSPELVFPLAQRVVHCSTVKRKFIEPTKLPLISLVSTADSSR